MMNVKDRLTALLTPTNTTLNSIDFVEIASADQKTLRVHFLNGVQVEGSIQNVTINGGETIATVPILNLNALQNHINEDTFWTVDSSNHCILTLQVNAPGDFSNYTLMIDSPVLDRFFQQVSFSFKALWDDSQRCLPAGSTEMWIVGHNFQFVTDEIAGKGNGQALLIDTQGSTPADPHICEVVHLISAEEQIDQFLNGQAVTHIIWSSDEALQFAHDLSFDDRTPPRSRTVLTGNLIPATQGRRYQETFAIDTSPIGAASIPLAIVRTGPNNTPDTPSLNYLYTLQNARPVWQAQDALDALPLPEIILEQLPARSSIQTVDWTWRRRLLDSEPFENAFMFSRDLAPRFTELSGYRYDPGEGGFFQLQPDNLTILQEV